MFSNLIRRFGYMHLRNGAEGQAIMSENWTRWRGRRDRQQTDGYITGI
jgi:hypothetical protein